MTDKPLTDEEIEAYAEFARRNAERNPVSWGHRRLLATITADRAEIARLRNACSTMNYDVSQTLGKALGYPWFKDDQKNFPGATEKDGVCVGDHVAESIAMAAASRIAADRKRIAELEKEADEDADEIRHYANLIHEQYEPRIAAMQQVVDAARELMARWDGNMHDGPERYVQPKGDRPDYWSPHAAMIESRFVNGLRIALSTLPTDTGSGRDEKEQAL